MTGPPEPRPVDVVLLGGSAGAVGALLDVIPAFPAGCRYAAVAVVHLPPDTPSVLGSVLQNRASVPVRVPEDKEPVARGVLWIAPPGYHLLVERDRTFSFSVDPPVLFSRPSIDVLFESAAEAYGPACCGVILSGANADGAAGLAAIARAGGLALVQDPSSASSPEMPRAALAAAPASRLPVDRLRDYLGALAALPL